MIIIKKRMKRAFILLTFLLIINTIFLGNIYLNRQHSSFNQNLEDNNGILKFSGTYTNITIDDSPSSPNNWAWAETQPWCSGNGTLLNPYIIEGHVLNMSSRGHGIQITNSTSSYFTIRNNAIQWNMLTNTMAMTGIYLSNTTKGQIVSNMVYNLTIGIHLIDCNNVDLINNTIFDQTPTNHMKEGILVEFSYFLNISKNRVHDISGIGTRTGMLLNNSLLNEITENIIYDISGDGLYAENSSFQKIFENEIYNNTNSGIHLDSSDNNTLYDNIILLNEDWGINVRHSANTSIKENLVELNTLDGIRTYYCNYTQIISNIVNNNSQNGIELYYAINNTISGNRAENNIGRGCYLVDSFDSIISDNIISNHQDYGILLVHSDDNEIDENTLVNNNYGIGLSDSHYNSLRENKINGSLYAGINLYESNHSIVLSNVVHNNTDVGIELEFSYNNVIEKNTVYNNLENGIYLFEESANNNVTRNIIRDNDGNGIYIENLPFGNLIWDNIFLRNGKHAVDDGTNNDWNNTTIGNYWDNWTSPDVSPNDGIVDDPYDIGGVAGSKDNLPIAEDNAPSIMINTPTASDIFGSIAPSFNVRITDIYLVSMWYTIDGGLNNYTFIANGTILQSAWDGMSDGALLLGFFASDIPGYVGTVGVSIIKDTTAPTIIINSPIEGEEFGSQAPLFNVTIIDPHLDSIWYSYDGGITTYAIGNNTLYNHTAWAVVPEGDVTITFYASDTVGNEASASIGVIKNIPAGGLDTGVIIIIGVSIFGGVAVVAVIYVFIKKRAAPA